MRVDARRYDAHLFLWGPVHSGRCRRSGGHRGRYPRAERKLPCADGLLRARARYVRRSRTVGERAPDHACVHARQRMARGWREITPRVIRGPRAHIPDVTECGHRDDWMGGTRDSASDLAVGYARCSSGNTGDPSMPLIRLILASALSLLAAQVTLAQNAGV